MNFNLTLPIHLFQCFIVRLIWLRDTSAINTKEHIKEKALKQCHLLLSLHLASLYLQYHS